MAKTKIKRPSLKKTLKRVDRMPKDMFGDGDVDLSTLPCLTKAPKKRSQEISMQICWRECENLRTNIMFLIPTS